ncbi:MAG: DUF3575 domain-containing protein [Flavobacteriaceae bacterium]|nr:DUF3575 domain-containing protein [Flavobacteriaceae bacterium]
MNLSFVKKKYLLSLLLLISVYLNAQTELKFNTVTALILVPNIGIEVGLSNHISFQLDATASFWDSFDGAPLQITQIFPEFRYYPKTTMKGFYIGAHAGYGRFTLSKSRFPQFIQQAHYTKENQMSGRNTDYGITLGYK